MSRNITRHIKQLRETVAQLEIPDEVDQRFGVYRDEPAQFCQEVLGAASATKRSDGTPYQFEILADIASRPRVAVSSRTADR